MRNFLGFLTLCLFFACSSEKSPHTQIESKLSPSLYQTLSQAQEITVFKVAPSLPKTGYRKISEEKNLTAKQIADLKKILLQDDSYHLNVTKSCLFIPDYGIKFNENMEIYYSSDCAQIKIISMEKTLILDIDPAQKKINQFFKELVL